MLDNVSHGLEKIYAFENINPKSVKTVLNKQKPATETVLTAKELIPTQLILPLGPYYQEALPSFKLKEPLSSLGLSSFAAKALQTKAITTVEDACNFLRQDPSSHKGLGLSHIEEVEEKINTFVGKDPFCLQKTVSFDSLVRIACSSLEPKMRFCLLARYHLEDLSGISSVELQEIQRLSKEQITKIIDQAEKLVLSQSSAFINDSLSSIAQSYLMPWLKYRHGFAPYSEVYERLYMITESPDRLLNTLEFLKCFGNPLKLICIQDDLYAADEATKDDFKTVAICIKSYFYQPFTTYPPEVLAKLATKELALQGKGFPNGFIDKVIMYA